MCHHFNGIALMTRKRDLHSYGLALCKLIANPVQMISFSEGTESLAVISHLTLNKFERKWHIWLLCYSGPIKFIAKCKEIAQWYLAKRHMVIVEDSREFGYRRKPSTSSSHSVHVQYVVTSVHHGGHWQPYDGNAWQSFTPHPKWIYT